MKELMFSVFPSENFVDLGLYQFGYEQCEPAHSFGPAVRNHFLFHYIISGTGILMANDSHGVTQTYHVKSGQGFMIFPGQINTYISPGNIHGLNLTDYVQRKPLNFPDLVWIIRFIKLLLKIFAKY